MGGGTESQDSSPAGNVSWRDGDAGNWTDAARGERGAWRSCTSGEMKLMRSCQRTCQSPISACYNPKIEKRGAADDVNLNANPLLENAGWLPSFSGLWAETPDFTGLWLLKKV